MSYEAYVYKITVNDTGKMYIGYHKGKFDGTYHHSSKCPVFAEDFAKGNNTIECLATGTVIEMATLEYNMLSEVDAKNNPDYYNKSNGGGMYVKSIGNDVMELYQLIKNKKLNISLVRKSLVVSLKRYQTRIGNTDTKHVQVLADTMMDKHGNIDDFDPIVVLEGFSKDGGDVIFDGNHTTLAAKQVSHVIRVPVMYVPKEIWSKFDSTNLQILANLLNPQLEKASKPGEVEDQIDWIFKNFQKKGIPADSSENVDYLKAMHFKTRTINSIIKKAKDKIELNDKLPSGYMWKNWKLYKTELDTILENASDSESVSMHMSSGKFNMQNILNKLKALIKAKSKKRHLTVYITHPNWNARQEWKEKNQQFHMEDVNIWIKPRGFHVDFVELEHKVKNSLEDI